MKTNAMLINAAARLLLDRRLWDDAKMFVEDVSSHDMSGKEKQAKVKNALANLFTDVQSFVINLAIELAVAWLESKSKNV